ncbi:hypothetical protein [Rhodocyclus tenuis]|uniref:Uncharacterized protein n=1 Tax=Rhodocyclus tenuis TaxID=1066 RepID=A0A840GDS2_RHOTE|nr:hypothetical protein [Rhodocyclus tenuis]MBB4248788.1 hypothetical protein [Rhodocyclus tenuis]
MTSIAPIHRPPNQPFNGVNDASLKEQGLERKKPGLKTGQKIRAARKLKPPQIEAIVRCIKAHALDNPEMPMTYAELAEKFQTSVVTLRSKAQIKAAMDDARKTASDLRNARQLEQADSGESGIKAETTLQALKEELRQLKREVDNYRKDHQLLTLYFQMRGQSLSQVLVQANACIAGESPKRKSVEGMEASKINPISRR